jgi:hypothetical protein
MDPASKPKPEAPFTSTASAKSILVKHRQAKKALAKTGMQMNESEH